MNSSSLTKADDRIEKSLRTTAQEIIAVIFGLLPLLFIPVAYAPLGYTKVFIVTIGVLMAIIFYSLSVLRSGTFKLAAPLALLAFWIIAGVSFLSALLSGDIVDSFVGGNFGDQTASFLILLALVATTTSIIGQSKASVMRLYMLLALSGVVLTVFHVLRVFFGAGFLSLDIFTSNVSSPLGGWNDLGLLFGLIVLLALVALEQLPLTKWGKVIFSFVILLSLVMLAVVNFVAVWVVLTLVSLLMLMYSLTKDHFSSQALTGTSTGPSFQSIALSAVVFIVSLVFLIGGPSLGAVVSKATNISYVEVRPSVEATINIARQVYSENAFVGIGPNRFADAWRLYKDPSINQTIFWNTDFNAGSGYIPTLLVTTGLFGVLAWGLFILLVLHAGYKVLFVAPNGDKFWFFIASSSFVATAYLWGMAFVYVPGATIILLATIFTSVLFVAYGAMLPVKTYSLSVAVNKRSAIVLVGLVMVVIIASASSLYFVTNHYLAVYSYNKAINTIADGTSIDVVERQVAEAYSVTKNDAYARQIAQYQIAKLNALLTLSEPTSEQQQQFQEAAANGISAAQLAINNDPTDAYNHATLGAILSILAATGIEGASDRAANAFSEAKKYDPQSPVYSLLEAQLKSRTGDLEGALTSAKEAVEMKNNYTDGLYFLAQVDIALGNTEEAITATRAITTLEPNNPARFYQLGVLESATGDRVSAIAAFEKAVALDPNYANARYFLALGYAEEGRTDDAVAQLTAVKNLNPDNAGVEALIGQIKNGTTTTAITLPSAQVVEPTEVESADGTVTTTVDPDTALISPVNVLPAADDSNSETSDPAAE